MFEDAVSSVDFNETFSGRLSIETGMSNDSLCLLLRMGSSRRMSVCSLHCAVINGTVCLNLMKEKKKWNVSLQAEWVVSNVFVSLSFREICALLGVSFSIMLSTIYSGFVQKSSANGRIHTHGRFLTSVPGFALHAVIGIRSSEPISAKTESKLDCVYACLF